MRTFIICTLHQILGYYGDQIKDRMEGLCSMHRRDEAYKIIVGEGKSLLWEVRCGWEDNIKMYVKDKTCRLI
jgi:hypothetical protein